MIAWASLRISCGGGDSHRMTELSQASQRFRIGLAVLLMVPSNTGKWRKTAGPTSAPVLQFIIIHIICQSLSFLAWTNAINYYSNTTQWAHTPSTESASWQASSSLYSSIASHSPTVLSSSGAPTTTTCHLLWSYPDSTRTQAPSWTPGNWHSRAHPDQSAAILPARVTSARRISRWRPWWCP